MVSGRLTSDNGIEHYRIDGVEQMEPFLMTVVSDTDLWMFVSSTGALTAGRIDADHALFPYLTDDRVHQAVGTAGPVTMIARTNGSDRELWRPFGPELTPGCTRSIAKSTLGDRLVFEERHSAWQLEVRMIWEPSDVYGWVRRVEIVNHADTDVACEVLDGFLDVMPAGVDAHTEQIRSNLADAYKRSECGPWGTVAIYSLESLITDRTEPAEALTATAIWSRGFDTATLHLDNRVLQDMLVGRRSTDRPLVTGRPGAYLLRGPLTVPAASTASFFHVADTNLGHGDLSRIVHLAGAATAQDAIADDIRRGSARLRDLLTDADGMQSTADALADAHHLSNVLFNSMRGGTFPHQHRVPVSDFVGFVQHRNREITVRHSDWLESLGTEIGVSDLRDAALRRGDPDLIRLTLEYLPLTFSRRHGDPSRPWNRFSIHVRNDDGTQLLAYEGNWRDIFQNWEALLYSFPAFFPHVVAKFVNASTIDGYNPYRISQDGIDWEVPDPDDPWSHIGYWGDHQIIYLLRLLEAWSDFEPDALLDWLERSAFVYADVPYRIADHDEIVADASNTIAYDEERARVIAAREHAIGTDGRLAVGSDGRIVTVDLLEKLVVPALAKLSNLVPGGGIWLNTQRPEWNDANNALAGPGLSMVTLYHLRRYLRFLEDLLGRVHNTTLPFSTSVSTWLADTLEIATGIAESGTPRDEHRRRSIVDALGRSAADHRTRVRTDIDSARSEIEVDDLTRWCQAYGSLLDESIRDGRRDDGLYHSYNRVSFPSDDTVHVDHLGPMLEGQVAVLSSGFLDGAESLALIGALFASGMYRADQDTFMLYPKVDLPSFLERNQVPGSASSLVPELRLPLEGSLAHVFDRDHEGGLHFRPGLVNAAALASVLDVSDLGETERAAIRQIYEEVFHHSSFTGRSASMYGYEGIGSIYWHMVSKLLLAVQESYWTAVDRGDTDAVVSGLGEAYGRIRAGLGYRKDPATFGAIPTDCYSHTPSHAGAQQPGMTGQVKEEILTRFGEFGLRIQNGRITLTSGLLDERDLLAPDRAGRPGTAQLTFCGVPMTIRSGPASTIAVDRSDGSRTMLAGHSLPRDVSTEVFSRNGEVTAIEWTRQL